MREISRRTFLLGAATGAAGVASAGVLSGCSSDGKSGGDDSGASGGYRAGTYTAAAPGKYGDVTVEVVLSDSTVDSVAVVKNYETQPIADSAIKYIPAAIVDGQTLNVDAISGATYTSNAILDATALCIKEAGGDSAALRKAAKAPESRELTAGTYTATAHGHHSDVEVEVTLGSDNIEDVKVLSSGETYNLSDAATNTLPGLIVENQSAGVDTITGATYTSRAIMSCVEDCVIQAGGNAAQRAFDVRVASEPNSTEEKSLDADVVVVGSGMSGIAAALSAQEQGADVVIVERMPFWGGISQTCGGGFVRAFDNSQESMDDFYNFGMHMYCGALKGETVDDQYPDSELMRIFADEGLEATQWLAGLGAPLIDTQRKIPVLSQPEYSFGASSMYIEGEEAPNVVGMGFKPLIDRFTDNGGQIMLETVANELITGSDGSVQGIKATAKGGIYTINANAVVLGAGGFGGSKEMIDKYAPSYNGEVNVTLVGNTGDGISMAVDIGAAVYDEGLMMGQYGHALPTDHSMVHPYLDAETPAGAIFVNLQGWRVNSETPTMYTGGTTYVNPDPTIRDYYWALSTQEILDANPEYKQMIQEQLDAGDERFAKGESLAELAKAIRITPNTLRYTVNRYNRFCGTGIDEDYGKTADLLIGLSKESAWYAVRRDVAYFGTVGGLKINTDAAVLSETGEPIKGLFAAGENANGGFYNLSYVGGRSMTQCLLTGKIAGANAAKA